MLIGESFPLWQFFIYALLLGFVAYGLSIFFYIKAQNKLGAAKTSAFYAVNPFIGAILSLIIFNDTLAWNFYVALGIMAIGTVFIIIDTIERQIEFFILAGHKC
ncbi:MAG: EamA family transporter [Clostridia bacterium]|nr:EamA family transporter [Clostridia bacterium]